MLTPALFGGAVGVDVFFVLSGFLITTILLREHDLTGGLRLRRFYFRRLIRLYPPLLLAVAVIFVPGLIFAPVQRVWLIDNILALSYTTPVARDLGWTFSKAWGHTWTLGIEEMFYLIWPPLLLVLFRRFHGSRRTAVVSATIGTLMMCANVAIEMTGERPSELLRSGGLFIGCALASALWNRAHSEMPKSMGWAGITLIAAAVVFHSGDGLISLAVIASVVGSVGLIAHLATQSKGAIYRVLAMKPAAYLGRISYELYLWHYPVLIVLSWVLGSKPIGAAWIAAPLSLALAAASHHLLTPVVDRWKHSVQ